MSKRLQHVGGAWGLWILALLIAAWLLGSALWLGGVDAVTAIFRWWA